ncbi:MAG: hypothetical protein RMK19_09245 [Bacteroidia bacterium]|nr:hypothetical protein [Bacteroidia bacterium]
MRQCLKAVILTTLVWAQPPNDNPCGAITLTPQSGCTYVNANLQGATATPGVPNPSCASYQGGDVWFTFTVPTSGRVVIQVNSSFDLGMAIYSAPNCNGPFTEIECDDDDGPGLNPTICRNGGSQTGCSGVDPGVTCQSNSSLTAGTTIWIRIWLYNNGNPGNTPFQICVIDCGSGGGGACGASNYNATTCPCPPPAGGSWCGPGCTSAGITMDDVYSPSWINLPFNFYFGGATYNQLLIGANGLVVFPPSGFTPGSYDSWSWGGYINDLYSIQFQNDIDPSLGGTICYRTIGTPPNRCFVVQYCDVPLFDDLACTGLTFTGELRLCEDGGIQININNKPTCTGWNSGGCFIGIVGNSNSDVKIIHNAQPCPSLTNSCYAFTPPASCGSAVGCTPLGVVLEAFEGRYDSYGVHLSWQSAAEESVRNYRIERSVDLQRWEEIAVLPARGRASTYAYLDVTSPRSYSSVYYRLRVESEKEGDRIYGPVEVVITARRPTRPEQSIVRHGEPLRFRIGNGEMVRVHIFDGGGRLLFEDTFCGPGEAEVPYSLLGRGLITVWVEVVGGERAAYRVVVL